jgi:hypothetical protein
MRASGRTAFPQRVRISRSLYEARGRTRYHLGVPDRDRRSLSRALDNGPDRPAGVSVEKQDGRAFGVR